MDYRQLMHQESQSLRTAKRERLEELYVLVTKWVQSFNGQALQLSLVMQGHISYNEYLDGVLDDDEDDVDFGRLQMIVDIYGEELGKGFQGLLKCREEINEIIGYINARTSKARLMGICTCTHSSRPT